MGVLAVFASLLRATFEGTAELVDVVRIVPGHDTEEVVEGASTTRVHLHTGARPLLVGQLAQEGERLRPSPHEGFERLRGVVAQILPLHRPAVRVRGRETRLVHDQDEPEAVEKRLLVSLRWQRTSTDAQLTGSGRRASRDASCPAIARA